MADPSITITRDLLWDVARRLSDIVEERHPGHFGDVLAPNDIRRVLLGDELSALFAPQELACEWAECMFKGVPHYEHGEGYDRGVYVIHVA